jgi:hypothetical protein
MTPMIFFSIYANADTNQISETERLPTVEKLAAIEANNNAAKIKNLVDGARYFKNEIRTNEAKVIALHPSRFKIASRIYDKSTESMDKLDKALANNTVTLQLADLTFSELESYDFIMSNLVNEEQGY